MRNLIKKILKEDFDSEDFSWVNTDLEPIRDDKHRYKIITKTIAKVKEYKDWRIHQDNFDGVVYWTGVDGYTGMATPEWDEAFKIPVDITWQHGVGAAGEDYDNITVIRTPEFKYVIEVEDWYRTKYFEIVYKILLAYINDEEVPGIIDIN